MPKRPGCDGPKAQPFAQTWATPRVALARAVRISAQRANGSPRLQGKPLARWAAEKQPLRAPFPWALPRAGRTRPLWGERFLLGFSATSIVQNQITASHSKARLDVDASLQSNGVYGEASRFLIRGWKKWRARFRVEVVVA